MSVYRHTVQGFDGYRIAVSVGGKLRQAYRKNLDEATEIDRQWKIDQAEARARNIARAKPTKAARLRGGVRGIYYDRADKAFVVRASMARFPISQGAEDAWKGACKELAKVKDIAMPDEWLTRMPKSLPQRARRRRTDAQEPVRKTA